MGYHYCKEAETASQQRSTLPVPNIKKVGIPIGKLKVATAVAINPTFAACYYAVGNDGGNRFERWRKSNDLIACELCGNNNITSASSPIYDSSSNGCRRRYIGDAKPRPACHNAIHADAPDHRLFGEPSRKWSA